MAAALQTSIARWKELDLDGKRRELDSQSLAIADRQEATQASRKRLAEMTKGFRRLGEGEKLPAVGPLVKAYQEEIDSLTKRSKFAESCFLTLYRALADVPDPVPALTVAQGALKSKDADKLAAENKQLRAQLEEYEKEMREIKNQDVTIRRLEEQLRDYDARLDELVVKAVSEKEVLLKEEHTQSLDKLKQWETELVMQLQNKEEAYRKLQRSHESAQSDLFDLKAKLEEEQASRQSAQDMADEELDRAQAQMLTLERERDKILTQLELVKKQQQQQPTPSTPSDDLKAELERKNEIIAYLRDMTASLQEKLEVEKERHEATRGLLADAEHAVKAVEDERDARPSAEQYRELRRKVQVLQAVEYNVVDEDAEGAVGSPAGGEPSLESILVDKNRRTVSELTKTKVKLGEAEAANAALEKKLAALDDKLASQQSLIQQLERDLARGADAAVTASGSGEPADDAGDANAPVAPGTPSNTSAERMEYLLSNGTKTDPDAQPQSSMLQIMKEQRDRFHRRVEELEGVTRSLRVDLSKLTNDNTTLQTDNVKLYEKIRFLQSYAGNAAAAASSSGAKVGASSVTARDAELGGISPELDTKYRDLYEESMNPFSVFNRKEKSQRYKDLSPAERLTLNFGQFLVGNRFARSFVALYAIVLHLMIFLTLYHFASTSHLERLEAEC